MCENVFLLRPDGIPLFSISSSSHDSKEESAVTHRHISVLGAIRTALAERGWFIKRACMSNGAYCVEYGAVHHGAVGSLKQPTVENFEKELALAVSIGSFAPFPLVHKVLSICSPMRIVSLQPGHFRDTVHILRDVLKKGKHQVESFVGLPRFHPFHSHGMTQDQTSSHIRSIHECMIKCRDETSAFAAILYLDDAIVSATSGYRILPDDIRCGFTWVVRSVLTSSCVGAARFAFKSHSPSITSTGSDPSSETTSSENVSVAKEFIITIVRLERRICMVLIHDASRVVAPGHVLKIEAIVRNAYSSIYQSEKKIFVEGCDRTFEGMEDWFLSMAYIDEAGALVFHHHNDEENSQQLVKKLRSEAEDGKKSKKVEDPLCWWIRRSNTWDEDTFAKSISHLTLAQGDIRYHMEVVGTGKKMFLIMRASYQLDYHEVRDIAQSIAASIEESFQSILHCPEMLQLGVEPKKKASRRG